jgi:uncharacterized spore protein YtfJ
MPSVAEVLGEAAGSIGAKRVFGEPYEKNGVTFIPAARVAGGGGTGEGPQSKTDENGEAKSTGTGFGMMGGPVGAYVIKGDTVRWMPAVDVNRVLFGFQVAAVVISLVVRSIIKARLAAATAAAHEAAKA